MSKTVVICINEELVNEIIEHVPDSVKDVLERKILKTKKKLASKAIREDKKVEQRKAKRKKHTTAVIDSSHSRRLELITKQTTSEKKFKAKLKVLKVRYEFQKIIYYKASYYIVDFYLPEYGVIFEIDGGYHLTLSQIKKDKVRSINLNKVGYKNILRYSNEEAINITELDLRSRIDSLKKLSKLGQITNSEDLLLKEKGIKNI